MRKNIFDRKMAILLFIFSGILFFSCYKELRPPQVQAQVEPALLNGRVVEFGSGSPLSDVKIIVFSKCTNYDFVFGCTAWDKHESYSNLNGKFSVSVSNFRNHSFRKTDYWTYINHPDVGGGLGGWFVITYNTPTHYYTSGGSNNFHIDSILVELFPVTNITVRVKNTGALTEAFLIGQAIYDSTKRTGSYVSLREGIDSTFQLPMFGNTQNEIFIRRNSPYNDTVSVQKMYIAKVDALTVGLTY